MWVIIAVVIIVIIALIGWWLYDNDSSSSDTSSDAGAALTTAKVKAAAKTATRPTGSASIRTNPSVNVGTMPNADPKRIQVRPATVSVKKMAKGRALTSTESPTFKAAASNAYADQPLTGGQIVSAYGPSTKANSSPKIAIIVCYNYDGLQADFNAFRSANGLPPLTLTIHKMAATTASDDGWAQEACLDTQYASLFANNITVVFAASASMADLHAAVSYAVNTVKPSIVSMSWGIDESYVAQANMQTMFESLFATPGIIFCASSGDSFTVSYPSSSPNVISVGGTTLNMVGNKRAGEYPWYDVNLSGSGHGISAIFKKPAYQVANTSAYRSTPDLCLIANTPNETGVEVVYQGSAYGIAGTSLSCPLFAGLVAAGLSQRTTPITQQRLMTDMYAVVNNNTTPFNEATDGIGAISNGFISYLAALQ